MKKILTSICSATLLFSATPSDNNAQAIKYLEANKVDQAYEILEQEYTNENYNNETLFLLAKSATKLGKYDSAVAYYEELLQRDKGANRVRLELAALYYKLGNFKKAKELFLIVQAAHPPKRVGDNINGFISMIDKTVLQGGQKSWSVSFDLGYMYDSNVNAGPNIDSVLIYDLPFTLSSDAKESSDHAIKYSFSLNHLKRFESNSRLYWQSSLGVNIVDYNNIHNLDSKVLYLSTGPSLKYNKYTFSLPLNLNYVIIGHQDSYYSSNIGLSPQISYQVKPNLSFSVSVSLGDRQYYDNPQRRAKTGMLRISSRYFVNQSSFIDVGGYSGRENSKTDIYSNNSRGLNFGYYKAFSQSFNIYLSESYSRTGYDGIEAAYNESRDDKTNTLSAQVSYFISTVQVNCSLNGSYTKNTSSIEMYTYKRNMLSFSFSKSF